MGTKSNPGKFDGYAVAEPDEPIFVLLARDPVARQIVRLWACAKQELHGPSPEVETAQQCASAMSAWAAHRPDFSPLEESIKAAVTKHAMPGMVMSALERIASSESHPDCPVWAKQESHKSKGARDKCRCNELYVRDIWTCLGLPGKRGKPRA